VLRRNVANPRPQQLDQHSELQHLYLCVHAFRAQVDRNRSFKQILYGCVEHVQATKSGALSFDGRTILNDKSVRAHHAITASPMICEKIVKSSDDVVRSTRRPPQRVST